MYVLYHEKNRGIGTTEHQNTAKRWISPAEMVAGSICPGKQKVRLTAQPHESRQSDPPGSDRHYSVHNPRITCKVLQALHSQCLNYIVKELTKREKRHIMNDGEHHQSLKVSAEMNEHLTIIDSEETKLNFSQKKLPSLLSLDSETLMIMS